MANFVTFFVHVFLLSEKKIKQRNAQFSLELDAENF